MSSIETKIVEMKLNNSQFLNGVKETRKGIEDLNNGLKFDGAGKGLSGLSSAIKGINLGPISEGVQQISSRFSALGIMAVTTLSRITNSAITAGANIARSLTIDPVKQGLQEYETNLNAIQTILANTSASGTTLKDVNASLAELNTYSDQTIYNFSEMARNIGTFTAAGVDLKTATGSIKGIANLAALSGSNSQQASTAMYQLSQAISSGRVSLQDWNSVVNAGMGGTVFQRALAQTAEKMGTLEKGSLKLTGSMKNVTIAGKSFRESVSANSGGKSWLTSEVLTKTLQQFTGDLTDAQLKAEGFSDAQIKAIQDQAKMAKSAATEVKTLSQLFGTLQETAGSGWSQTWQLIFGDFAEAKKMWTQVNDVLSGFINKSSDARNKVVGDWKALGGRTVLLKAIGDAFKGILSVLDPIKKAFTDIFPPATGKQLFSITQSIAKFAKGLTVSSETAGKIRRIFAGLFAVLDIGVTIIKEFGKMLFGLGKDASGASGSILDVAAKVGDFLVRIRDAVKSGDGLSTFFKTLGNVIRIIASVILAPIKLITMLGEAINRAFGSDISKAVSKVGSVFSDFGQAFSKFLSSVSVEGFQKLIREMFNFSRFGDILANSFSKMYSFFNKVKSVLGPGISKVFSGIGNIGKKITELFSDIDYGNVLDTINTGLLGVLVLSVKKFLGSFGKTAEKESGGIKKFVSDLVEKITGPFEALTDTLNTMQNTLRAMTLLQIAAAVGVLAASVVALSKIDSAGLTRAVSALGVLFFQLSATMAVMQKISIGGGMGQLILLASAIRILTSAVKNMADLSWGDLAKGLTGTVGLMAALVAVARLMPDGKKMISSSLGIVVMASAIRILATAVEKLSELSWGEIARGLTGVAGLLAALALFSLVMKAGKIGPLQGAGLILLATGINILATAVGKFADLSWGEIARGLTAMGGGLIAVSLALKLIPVKSVVSAAGVLILAQSLGKIAEAMSSFSAFSWTEIAKGLVTMAGALGMIGLALALIPPSSIVSAAAVFVVASSLGKVAEALDMMGSMSWGDIAKGLVAMGGALGIIALAMYGMSGALPGAAALIVVAGALTLLAPVLTTLGSMSWGDIAKGLTMLGGSLLILALGVTAMSAAIVGAAALVIITGALTLMVPMLIALGGMSWGDIAKGLVALAGAFAVLGLAGLVLAPVVPALLGLGGAIALLGAGVALAGVGMLAFAAGLTALAASGGAATAVLVGMVSAILGLLPQVATAVGQAMITFATVISQSGPQITAAITTVIISFLAAIDKSVPKMAQTFQKVFDALIKTAISSTPKIIALVRVLLTSMLSTLVSFVPQLVIAGMNILTSILNGIAAKIGGVVTAATNVIVAFLDGIGKNLPRIVDAGMKTIISFVNGTANAIRANTGELRSAGINLATAIADGMTGGLASSVSRVASAAKNMASSALSSAKNFLGIKSPSREFYKLGQYSAEGYAKGLDGSKDQIRAAQKTMLDMLKTTREAIDKDIDAQQKKLANLRKGKKTAYDNKAIKEAEAALLRSRIELTKVKKAQNMAITFNDEMRRLDILSDKAASVAKQLEDANRKLSDAIRARDDYAKSISDQYGKVVSFEKDTTLEAYFKNVQKQIDDNILYSSQLRELQRRGLNDETYRELLTKGPEAIPFAKELLNGEREAIVKLNAMTKQITTQGKNIGNHAARSLYQAGVDSAQGLVSGLKSQQANIEKQMDNIAGYMVRAIKKSLGIKSPSKEFEKIGLFSMEGLAKGLKDDRLISKATSRVGSGVVDGMRSAIENMNDQISSQMNLNPVIKPVLDLSGMSSGASRLGGLLGSGLNVSDAYFGAQSTLSSLGALSDSYSGLEFGTHIELKQYNTSPKALSEAEIYRNTKNLLSRAKGALTEK